MASTGPTLDPLTSQDGTPVTIEKSQGRGRALTADDFVIEQLVLMNDSLGKILKILALEFEQEEELINGIED
jgi:hypothetical protein